MVILLELDDTIFSTYGNFSIYTIYVDKNHTASSINNRGYRKYCYEVVKSENYEECGTNVVYNWILENSSYTINYSYNIDCMRKNMIKTASCNDYGSFTWYK